MGITFVVVVMIAMIIGVTTAVYYAWMAPCIDRQKRKRALRKFQEKRRVMAEKAGSPGSEDRLRTPEEAENSLCKEDLTFDEKAADEGLTPPAPVYVFPQKFRFSTSTQDGVWWFV